MTIKSEQSVVSKTIPSLTIGNLVINPPIIQGGMGVRVSGPNLAAAVANEGAVGTIASVGLSDYINNPNAAFDGQTTEALRDAIRKAKSNSKGVIAVNILVVLSNYEDLVKVCVEENVDIIVCGSGLPLDLPKFTQGTDIKIIPIVSSPRAFNIIYQKWKKNYNKIPDAVIVEGVEAGGHIGFSYDDIVNHTAPKLETIVEEMVELMKTLDEKIPIIAAGGIFDGNDIARFLKLGASGVQMATRFVCTEECDVDIKFKEAYISASKDDLEIIKSPVGLPGRVIKNNFVTRILNGETSPFNCPYRCLRTCNPKLAPYCIARVLSSSALGMFENAFAFAGSNAYRCIEIVSVKALIATLKRELLAAY
jgi:NAD(P)H-dependent flavin oxidoreductase YrpB (nitropropane dioxygenase family)